MTNRAFILGWFMLAGAVFGQQSQVRPPSDNWVSLRDYAWTQHYPWIGDFEYERIITRQQAKDVTDYSMAMKIRHVETLIERNLPWVLPTPSADEKLMLGYSYGWPEEPRIQPQPIFGYRITDPDADGEKMKVVLTGGNHAREAPGCWALHAMVEFLVSEDPRAQVLRRNAEFYVYPVVNPDGKMYLLSDEHRRFIDINGSPELKMHGHNNHNRAWDTEGLFVSIDTIKSAILNDAGGRADYLLDFHGVPHVTFCFVCPIAARSPYSRALAGTGRDDGISQRYSTELNLHPGVTRSWAMSEKGLEGVSAFTPEIAPWDKEQIFKDGMFFALALYNVITDHVSDVTQRQSDVAPRKPAAPAAAWLFDGDTDTLFAEDIDPVAHNVRWSHETRFDYPANRALVLDGKGAYVDFGQPASLDMRDALTVAFWVRADAVPSELTYIVGRYQPRADRRSWTLAQREHTQDMIVILSADGSHDRDHLKRYLSTLWPFSGVFDGQWRHVAFTFAGGGEGRLRLFVDGIELLPQGHEAHIFSNGLVPSLHGADVPMTVGGLTDSDRYFEGLIDELAVWDSALGPEEIMWLSRNSLRELTE